MLSVLLLGAMLSGAQAQSAQRQEIAMLKWDGNDKVQVMTPTESKVINVWKEGGQRLPNIPEEEYCLTWVANKMAQEGWQLGNLNNRRIIMHRPAK